MKVLLIALVVLATPFVLLFLVALLETIREGMGGGDPRDGWGQ